VKKRKASRAFENNHPPGAKTVVNIDKRSGKKTRKESGGRDVGNLSDG